LSPWSSMFIRVQCWTISTSNMISCRTFQKSFGSFLTQTRFHALLPLKWTNLISRLGNRDWTPFPSSSVNHVLKNILKRISVVKWPKTDTLLALWDRLNFWENVALYRFFPKIWAVHCEAVQKSCQELTSLKI
jgi:hypothetical protein